MMGRRHARLNHAFIEKNLLVEMANLKRLEIVLLFSVFTVGAPLVAPHIRAAESPNPVASTRSNNEPFASNGGVALNLRLQTTENLSFGAVAESSDGGEESASELNRKLTNPVSDIWSISNQFNNFELNNGQWNNNWNFQPVLPVSLTKEWNLITRPVMPFYNIVPHETAPNEFARDAGLGDLTLLELLSPSNSGNWVQVVKLGRLPIKINLAVQYIPVHPRINGQEWNVQVSITPVIPKLVKGVLFQ